MNRYITCKKCGIKFGGIQKGNLKNVTLSKKKVRCPLCGKITRFDNRVVMNE